MSQNNLVVTFKKPHMYEGKEYEKVDLKGLDTLTTADLIEADNQFSAEGQFAMVNEMTTGYSIIVAAKVTDLPIEFYRSLPAKEGMKIKGIVMTFLND